MSSWTGAGSGVDSVSSWTVAGSGVDSVSSWNGVGPGVDSVSCWTGAGSGVDSVSSWNGAGSCGCSGSADSRGAWVARPLGGAWALEGAFLEKGTGRRCRGDGTGGHL